MIEIGTGTIKSIKMFLYKQLAYNIWPYCGCRYAFLDTAAPNLKTKMHRKTKITVNVRQGTNNHVPIFSSKGQS